MARGQYHLKWNIFAFSQVLLWVGGKWSKAEKPHGVFKALWTWIIALEQEEKLQSNNCIWTTFKGSIAASLPTKSTSWRDCSALGKWLLYCWPRHQNGQKVFMNQVSKYCRDLAEQTPKILSSWATRKDLSKHNRAKLEAMKWCGNNIFLIN